MTQQKFTVSIKSQTKPIVIKYNGGNLPLGESNGKILSFVSGAPAWVNPGNVCDFASSPPAGQEAGELWYNSEQNTLNVFDGENWNRVSSDDGYF